MGNEKVVIFCGIKHCGKTSLGKMVADMYGYQFEDLDNLMLQATGLQYEHVREIWMELGRDGFQELESNVMESYICDVQIFKKELIFSMGGGTIENFYALKYIKELGLKIYFEVDEKILFKRIINKGVPAFLDKNNLEENFAELYARRHVLYKEFADHTIKLEDVPKIVNAKIIKEFLDKNNAWV